MPEYKEYKGITRAEVANLRTYLAKEKIVVPEGDDVAIEGPFGIKLRVIYDEPQEILKVRITEKPFYVPESQIWKIIDEGTAPYAG